MDNRLKLHAKLESLIGNSNVYFQPPASKELAYPCVIYSIGNGDVKYANDGVYCFTNRYTVSFIYKRPMPGLIETIVRELPKCREDRVYVVDNLNHYVFNVYY